MTTGLRAYDVFMAATRWPVLSNAAARVINLAEAQQTARGVPVFLLDESAPLYSETVSAHGSRMALSDLPPAPPPFPSFWCEWGAGLIEGTSVRRGVFCRWDHSGSGTLDGLGYVTAAGTGKPYVEPFCVFSVHMSDTYAFTGEGVTGGEDFFPDGDSGDWEKEGQYCLGVIAFSMALLAAKNVSKREEAVPRTLRRHPGPYAATVTHKHYTLDIPGASEFRRSIAEAGDEVSRKRLHIVRGHFADYSEGGGLFGKLHGRYYIAPHVRGSASVGTVSKDYRIRAG